MAKRKANSRSKAKTKSKLKKNSRKKRQQSKLKVERKKALWKSLAESEGALTTEQQLTRKASAVKRYQELKQLKNLSTMDKYKRQLLGYAPRLRHDKPVHPMEAPKAEKESLLKAYKKVVLDEQIPTLSQVGWENFKQDISKLPPEVQAEITQKLDSIIAQWGEEAVMKYLDNVGMFDGEQFEEKYNPYILIYAKAYLYRLQGALLLAESGELPSDALDDEYNEIMRSIESYFKNPSSKQKLYNALDDSRIIEEIDQTGLREYFEEQWEEY